MNRLTSPPSIPGSLEWAKWLRGSERLDQVRSARTGSMISSPGRHLDIAAGPAGSPLSGDGYELPCLGLLSLGLSLASGFSVGEPPCLDFSRPHLACPNGCC